MTIFRLFSNFLTLGLLSFTFVMNPVSAYADSPAIHGMMIFGTKNVYLSHLPMFMSPHDYQVIYLAELDSAGMNSYQQALGTGPKNSFYTLAPQPFILPNLADNSSVNSSLFRGIFDQGGTPVSAPFKTRFTKRLFFKKFVKNQPRPQTATFLLVGNPNGEIFLIHEIFSPPDFDQILEVQSLPVTLQQRLQEEPFIRVTIKEQSNKPLTEKRTLTILVDETRGVAREFRLGVGKQIYLGTEDLK